MIKDQELNLITKFVIKTKQERYLTFLAQPKTRHKFTKELYHFNDFDWKLFREISGNEIERETIAAQLKQKNISTCYVISADPDFDGIFITVDQVINEVIGTEGTIIIFGDADFIYYEGEAPNNRYISIG